MQVRSPGPVGLRHSILPQESSGSSRAGCATSSAGFPTTSRACVSCAFSDISRAATPGSSAARVSPDSWEAASEHDNARNGADNHGQSAPCGNVPAPTTHRAADDSAIRGSCTVLIRQCTIRKSNPIDQRPVRHRSCLQPCSPSGPARPPIVWLVKNSARNRCITRPERRTEGLPSPGRSPPASSECARPDRDGFR